jgi:hypothetical protein
MFSWPLAAGVLHTMRVTHRCDRPNFPDSPMLLGGGSIFRPGDTENSNPPLHVIGGGGEALEKRDWASFFTNNLFMSCSVHVIRFAGRKVLMGDTYVNCLPVPGILLLAVQH